MNTTEFHAACERETEAAGYVLGSTLKSGDLVLLRGELGAGKTCFVRGALRALGCGEAVASPTFQIASEHPAAAVRAVHLDLYRLQDEAEFEAAGLGDYLDGSWLVFAEWPDNAGDALYPDAQTVEVSIKYLQDGRQITVRDRRAAR